MWKMCPKLATVTYSVILQIQFSIFRGKSKIANGGFSQKKQKDEITSRSKTKSMSEIRAIDKHVQSPHSE